MHIPLLQLQTENLHKRPFKNSICPFVIAAFSATLPKPSVTEFESYVPNIAQMTEISFGHIVAVQNVMDFDKNTQLN